jgi:hypothetical protein
MPNAFAEIAGELDLVAATRSGSKRNDLLPPRHEDSVAGETGKRFSEGLKTRLERGRYDPSPAVFVHVPKHGSMATRPAALLTLSDRVVYDALVMKLRPRIEAAMLGADIVFWPRGTATDKRWAEFEKAPLETGQAYVTRADITGFYECVDHEHLREALVDCTGQRPLVNALVEFLNRVMHSQRGLPQGLDASDPLATAYLIQVDADMSRECVHYVRNGDDIRLATRTHGEARRALHAFETALRRRGLLLSASKSKIMSAAKYRNG